MTWVDSGSFYNTRLKQYGPLRLTILNATKQTYNEGIDYFGGNNQQLANKHWAISSGCTG